MPIIDVVIARYNEDIAWVRRSIELIKQQYILQVSKNSNLTINVYIYNKGPPLPNECSEWCIIETLPNIGRESHTYLYHILKYYNSFLLKTSNNNENNNDNEHYIIFSQGYIEDHMVHYRMQSSSDFLVSILLDCITNKERKSASTARAHNVGGFSAIPSYRMFYHKEDLYPANMTYGDWFTQYVQPKFPEPCIWWISAIFSINTNIITNKPKEYYDNLFKTIPGHSAPEVAHFFERAWYYVFQ